MLLTFAAFFFVLSIVVLVHELGHFAVAKLNGIYVSTFSFGFGPKLLKGRIGETEYALSALPFGGYVKFAGELVEDAENEEALWEELEVPAARMYRNKKPLQRMSVVLAGPAMNFLLAFLVYTGSILIQGIVVTPTTTIAAVEAGSGAEESGLRAFDRILSIEGVPMSYWEQIYDLARYEDGARTTFTVLRGADTLRIAATARYDSTAQRVRLGISPLVPPRIGDVKRGSPAARAGLRTGALIISINDTAVATYDELEARISPNAGAPLAFEWEIGGERRSAVITPAAADAASEGERLDVVKVGQIGIGPLLARQRVSVGASVGYGSRAFRELFWAIIDFLKKLFTGNATIRAVGGPLRVGIMAGEMIRWGFSYLIYFLAFFSLNLAIFNLLPILPFDGGHFMLGLVELVSRRPIGRKVQHVLMQIGTAVLIALMVFILSVDLFNIFR